MIPLYIYAFLLAAMLNLGLQSMILNFRQKEPFTCLTATGRYCYDPEVMRDFHVGER